MAETVEARAKINLFLKVAGPRPDGFHDLETVFHSVMLHDLLRFDLTTDDPTDAEPFFRFSFTCDDEGIGPDNLVPKAAARIVAEWESGRSSATPLDRLVIDLQKKLPVGAGLAGGSADAAATLMAANKIYSFGMFQENLVVLAAELGSDVPFCLVGGCALGKGRGEILSPLPLLPRCAVAIAVPPFAIATADAYGWLDEARASSSQPRSLSGSSDDSALELFLKALSTQDLETIGLLMHNDFEAPVFKRHPELRQLKESALKAGAAGALLSGSGSALFALCKDDRTTAAVAKQWEHALPGVTVHISEPASTGLG